MLWFMSSTAFTSLSINFTKIRPIWLDERSFLDRHQCHMATWFRAFVDKDCAKLPVLNWLSNNLKQPV